MYIWRFLIVFGYNGKLSDRVKENLGEPTECGQKTKFLEESVKGDIEISLDSTVCNNISD